MQLSLTLGRRLWLLGCIVMVAFVFVSIISGLVGARLGLTSATARILTVVQDVVVFILPAVATAMLVTRRPATLLAIDRKPRLGFTLLAIATLIVAVPAMNAVIALNEAMPLPDAMADSLLAMEAQADAMIAMLVGPHTVANLIVGILIVGVFAGLSEEILFRGAFQRLLSTGGLSAHAAIWTAAAVFSLVHMEILGFLPRMLLGAYFGYALVWGRSLWTPVILHAVNNSLYVAASWAGLASIDTLGADPATPSSWLWLAASVILTALGLLTLRRMSQPKRP